MPSINHINNRKHMLKHPSQGSSKKVLCVCSGGLLRSPTVAWVLSNPPFNFNTRACGITPKYALIQFDEFLLEWADEIICMEHKHWKEITSKTNKPVHCLELSDDYVYRDEELIKEATKKLKERYEGQI